MSHQIVDTICSSLKRVWSSGRLVILTSTVVTLSVIGVRQLGALQSLELTTYDQMLRLRHDPGPDDRLLVVAITENDIRRSNEHPLPDATVAKLLQTLEQHHPRAIGLDVIRDVPIGSGRDELTQTFQKSDRIIGVCKFPDALSPGYPPPPGLSADLTSFADLPPDSGGVLRRALLIATPPAPAEGSASATDAGVCSNSDYPLGSFALSLASRYLKDDGIEPELTEAEDLKLGPVLFKRLEPGTGPYKNAELNGYQILLNYRSPNQVAPQVTLTDVLSGKVDPNLIKDRVVLVGYTAPSVHDEFTTPYTVQQRNGPMPGVVAHAQIVSQLLSAVAGERSLFWFMPQWGEWLWILGWSVTGGIMAWRVRHPLILGLSLSVALGLGTGICFGILTQTGWIPLVPPALALIGTAGGVLLFDRFDKAAQAIYKGIKGFLKIDIDIDEAKKEEQVAQITDSTYFQFLEQRADELRNQKLGTPPASLKQSIPPRITQEDPPSPLSSPPPPSSHSPSSKPAQAEEIDYLQQLQQKSEQQRKKRPTPHTPHP
ncbi:MAG TPA: CHASE2 domain-containing protein, partial [Crinalium sp.]